MPLLAALLSGLSFALLQITFKRYLKATTPPYLLPAWFGFLLPFWLTFGILAYRHQTLAFDFTNQALKWPLLWATCTVTTTTLLTYFLSRFSLSEVLGYKKALITLGALLADVFVFHRAFALPTLAAIGLLLSAATLLSHARAHLPSAKQGLILCLWCVILTAQISLYRQGQMHQPSVMSHTVLAQVFATAGYALLWLIPAVRRQYVPFFGLMLALACSLTGVALEGYAYAGLPLAVVMLVTMLPATLLAAADLYRGDLPRTPKTFAALALLLSGFILLIIRH